MLRVKCHPRGFTLVEMLIVLAVLVSMLAFSWPSMQRLWRRSTLQSAADQVRAALGKARLKAIRSGTPQQFRFQPGGRRFEIAPRAVSVGSDRELFGRFAAADDHDGQPPQPSADEPVEEEITVVDLDEGLYFWRDRLELGGGLSQFSRSENGTVPFGASPRGERETAPLGADQHGSPEGWSAPIVFYPNGRTLNARFGLTDGRDYFVQITLRGLTGRAKQSPVMVRPQEQASWEETP